jgi:hypothetical protein
MIPASYLYKNVVAQTWGDPCNTQAEPIETNPRGPRNGHFAGLATLIASVLPLAHGAPRRPVRMHA